MDTLLLPLYDPPNSFIDFTEIKTKSTFVYNTIIQ